MFTYKEKKKNSCIEKVHQSRYSHSILSVKVDVIIKISPRQALGPSSQLRGLLAPLRTTDVMVKLLLSPLVLSPLLRDRIHIQELERKKNEKIMGETQPFYLILNPKQKYVSPTQLRKKLL